MVVAGLNITHHWSVMYLSKVVLFMSTGIKVSASANGIIGMLHPDTVFTTAIKVTAR